VIDAGYRGDVGVLLYNSRLEHYKITKGDRIAQILFQKIEDFDLVEVDNLDDSQRGVGGFGSSGT
jgi:dUTP pyrophosphatase